MSSVAQASRLPHADITAREVVLKPENSDRRGPLQTRDHFRYFFREIILHNDIVTLAQDIGRQRESADTRVCHEHHVAGDTVDSLHQRLRIAGKEAAYLLRQLEERLADMSDDETRNPYLERMDAVRLNKRDVDALLSTLPGDDATR